MSPGEACSKVGKESVEIQVLMPFSQQAALRVDAVLNLVVCVRPM